MRLLARYRHGVWAMALLLCGATACSGSPASPPASAPAVAESASPPLPAPRSIKLEDGSYVDIRPGLEAGFAYCCGDDDFRMEIECSDGLLRCYKRSGKRWKQTFGRHCKSSLNQQCYEQTCARVCEAYQELGPERWHDVIP